MNRARLIVGLGIISLAGSTPASSGDVFQVLVEDHTMTWGADTFGYMQVQDVSNWQTLCEFNVYTLDTPSSNRDETVCALDAGIYSVINHTTRQRIEGIAVGGLDGLYTAPMVETIDGSWVHYDPYLVIDANTVYSELSAVPSPANLDAIVYSPTAAELFWNRAKEPGLRYDVYLGDQLLGSTDGTSLFLDKLQPGEVMQMTVIARNSAGSLSEASHIELETPSDDNHGGTPTELQIPTGLRASVYSANTLELFWDRQGPGQQFEVFNGEGDLLVRTDGVSYFVSNLPVSDEFQFSVRAVDDSNSSESAMIVVDLDDPGVSAAITIDNAEALLAEVVGIANRELFDEPKTLLSPGISTIVSYGRDAVTGGAITGEGGLPGGMTLIEGTVGGYPSGGEYLCDAGGSAAAIEAFYGEVSTSGYLVSLEQCMLPSGKYSGTFTQYDGGRSGYYGSIHENAEVVTAPDNTTYHYDSSESSEWNRYRKIGARSMVVHAYSVQAEDGEKIIDITGFDSVLSENHEEGKNSANIAFVAHLPAFSSTLYSAVIELDYHYDQAPTDATELWNSGFLSISAADGSELIATLRDTDGDLNYESLSIVVGEDEIVRPLSDGYQVLSFSTNI